MEIRGSQSTDYIRIEPIDFDGVRKYSVTASIDGQTVTDDDVALLHVDKFMGGLRTFERNRHGKVILEGTSDFRLTIEPDGSSGAAWISISLCKVFSCHSSHTGSKTSGVHSLSGGFSIAGELVAELVRCFRELIE